MSVERLLAGYSCPSQSSFEPFKVTFNLSSPLVLAHPYIHGDSLIMSLLMKYVLKDEYYNLDSKNPINVNKYLSIPLKSTNGIYHASVSQFDTDIIKLETIYKRFDDKHIDNLKSKKTKVKKGEGFFKGYMIKLPSIPSKTVTFYFNGNINECTKIFNMAVALGKKTDIGYGFIKSFNIERTDKDFSFVKDKICMRPFPAKDFKNVYGIPSVAQRLACRIPYWDKRNIAMCAAPGCEFYGRT